MIFQIDINSKERERFFLITSDGIWEETLYFYERLLYISHLEFQISKNRIS